MDSGRGRASGGGGRSTWSTSHGYAFFCDRDGTCQCIDVVVVEREMRPHHTGTVGGDGSWPLLLFPRLFVQLTHHHDASGAASAEVSGRVFPLHGRSSVTSSYARGSCG